MPDLQQFNVHLFALVRIKYENIESDSPEGAAEKAIENFVPYDIHHGEYADDIPSALVDVVGDTDFSASKVIDFYAWDDSDGDHPQFTFKDWQAEVSAGNARIGYREWVQRQIGA